MTGPGTAAPRRRWSTSTPRTARASTRQPTWPSSRACCRWTATAASRACWRQARGPVRLLLLGALPKTLLRDPPGHRLAAGGGGAAPDRRALRHRGGDPRPPGRGAACGPAGAQQADRRRPARLAHGPAGSGSRAIQPGRGDPLRPAPLAGAGAVPRGRPARAGHQHRRAGIRPIALGKNSLFAGSDGGARHWAIVASLVATAKLNGVEPLAWLTDVLERMVSGRTKAHELDGCCPGPGRQHQPSTCDSRGISAPLT